MCHPRCVCENWKWYAVKHNKRKLVYIAVCETGLPRHLLVIRLTDGFVHSPYQMAQCYKNVSTRQAISRWMKTGEYEYHIARHSS